MSRFFTVACCATSLLLLSVMGHAEDAGTIATEFRASGEADLALLQRISSELPSSLDPSKFQEVLETTRIEVLPKLMLRGAEVDAINYPSRHVIEVSSSRWADMASHPERKRYLVMHELFGIMEVELDNFFVSIRIKQEIEEEETSSAELHAMIQRKMLELVGVMRQALFVDFAAWRADLEKAAASEDYRLCTGPRPFFSGYWDGRRREVACDVVRQDLKNLRNRIKLIGPEEKILALTWEEGSILERFPHASNSIYEYPRLAKLENFLTPIAADIEGYTEEASGCANGKEGLDCEFRNLRVLLEQAPAHWKPLQEAFQDELRQEGFKPQG